MRIGSSRIDGRRSDVAIASGRCRRISGGPEARLPQSRYLECRRVQRSFARIIGELKNRSGNESDGGKRAGDDTCLSQFWRRSTCQRQTARCIALHHNPQVPLHLLGKKWMPRVLPSHYGIGSSEEGRSLCRLVSRELAKGSRRVGMAGSGVHGGCRRGPLS